MSPALSERDLYFLYYLQVRAQRLSPERERELLAGSETRMRREFKIESQE
jgi:hypothetical protein